MRCDALNLNFVSKGTTASPPELWNLFRLIQFTQTQKTVQSEDLLVYEFQNPDKVNSGVFFRTNSLYMNLLECSRFSG